MVDTERTSFQAIERERDNKRGGRTSWEHWCIFDTFRQVPGRGDSRRGGQHAELPVMMFAHGMIPNDIDRHLLLSLAHHALLLELEARVHIR